MLSKKKYKRDNFIKAKNDRTATLFKKAYELSRIFLHNPNQSGRVAVLVEHNQHWQAFLSNEDVKWPIRFDELGKYDVKYTRHIRTEEQSTQDFDIQKAAVHAETHSQDDDNSSLSDVDLSTDQQVSLPIPYETNGPSRREAVCDMISSPPKGNARPVAMQSSSRVADMRGPWRPLQRADPSSLPFQALTPPSDRFVTPPPPPQSFVSTPPSGHHRTPSPNTSASSARKPNQHISTGAFRISKPSFFRRSTRARGKDVGTVE